MSVLAGPSMLAGDLNCNTSERRGSSTWRLFGPNDADDQTEPRTSEGKE